VLVNDDDDDDDQQQQQQPIVFARVFGVVSERDTNAVKGATEKSFELFWWFLVPLRSRALLYKNAKTDLFFVFTITPRRDGRMAASNNNTPR